jgi:hypothetical protein
MGLDDLFKNIHRNKHAKHYDNHDRHHGSYDHHNDHYYRQGDHNYYRGHHGHNKADMILSVLRSLPHKKAIIIGLIIALLLILIIGIALLWAIFPLITQAVGYVEANGIKSLVDGLLPYLEKLWKGNG